ncbi:MAG TPA: cytochrome c [Solirubrobacterales bacterium]|jgi:mono/diheme cytochrome c family protein|nr:cytochrome c [Solirubrobacterales bacterium]
MPETKSSKALILLVIIAAMAGALVVAGCGGSSSSSEATTTEEAEPETGGGAAEEEAEEPAEEEAETGGAEAGGESAAVAAGKTVFTANCGTCHTLKEAGTSGTVGPNLDELEPDMATVEHQVETGGGGMPAFKGQLSTEEIADVATYVSTVAGTE